MRLKTKYLVLINNLATNTSLNAKLNEVKDEISNFTSLATTAALTIVENKIQNLSDLVKKADYDAKNIGNGKQFFTASDYSMFTSNTLDAKIILKS